MKFIPYGRQLIDDSDIAAAVRVLRSDFLTCGPEIESFEHDFASMVGARYAVAVCNATAALHLAMLVTGVSREQRVVTSPNTFLASANCAAYAGAIPDFCDIDPVSYNLDPAKLEEGWRADTKAVVAVDYAGQPCNMPIIAQIARARGAVVIEDACHGTGGGFQYEGKIWMLGGHPWADITTFSFHPVKSMTTGEGGMLVTDNEEYARRARLLRAHGVERSDSRFLSSDICLLTSEHGPWFHEMRELGYNYRITDLQCALGSSQLKKLPAFIRRRQEIVTRYNQAFDGLPYITTPNLRPPASDCKALTSWHLYTLRIDFSSLGQTRTDVMMTLRQKGVGSQVLYIPVYLQPWYRQTYGYGPGKCPVAESFYSQALSLPLYAGLADEDIERVIQAIRALVQIK
jgi:perosamine synthetase